MKNPLLSLPVLLLAASAALAAPQHNPQAICGKLRPWDLSAEGLEKLKPVKITKATCAADLGKLSADDLDRFYRIRMAMIKQSVENANADDIDAIISENIYKDDAPQFFNPYERFKIKAALASGSACRAFACE